MSKLNLNDGKFRPSIDGIENGKTSQVTGMNSILNLIMGNINYLKSLVDSKANKTIQVIAGNGLVGGGDLSTNRTLNIASADDGITVNADNIKLNIVDNATTDSATRAGSAKQIKLLSENKQNKTDSGLKTNKKNVIDAINSSLNMKERPASFDGTFIDFYNKFKIGSYDIPREVGYFDKFGFPDGTYNYGVLTVYETVEGALRIDFYADEHREKLTTTIYQFGLVPTRPEWQSKTFKDNVKWNLQLTDKSKLFLGTSGISSVTYIQDSGTKTQGQGYIDKDTGQVYLCLETNTDTTITNKFMSITNVELGKKVKSGFWKLNPKQIGNNSTVTDLNTIYERGFYTSTSYANKFINVPESNMGAFELTVSSITDSISHTTQLIKSIINNNYYVRTQTAGIGNPVSWTKWTKLLLDTDIVDNLTTADKSKVLSANMGKYIEQIGIFGGKKTITASDDLDTLTQSGIYWCNNVTKEQFNYEGVDFYGFGTLIVSNVNKTGDIFMQMFISHNWEQDNARNRRGCVLIRFVLDGRATNWYPILTSNSSEFLGGLGINYSNVFYIQDVGQKTAGNGYVDKTTGQLYLCKTTNSDTSVTSNFVLATNIEIAKRQHFTKTILFDEPEGQPQGTITLSDNWENYDEFIVYGSSDRGDYVGSKRFKKEDIEYSISEGQRYMIYGEAGDYWLAKITNGSKTWASGDHWENCIIFRIIGIKYGG